MSAESFRLLWERRAPMIGTWCSMPSAYSVELIASLGYDWICIDLQHGFIDEATLPTAIGAATAMGTAALVRTRWNDPPAIMRALDAGAVGVIVPLVHDAAAAAAAAAACRYPPHGERSYGPMRPLVDGSPTPVDPICVVMVESARGIEAAEEIAAAPGVDGVFVGPADLSLSQFGQRGADVRALAARVAVACEATSLVAGTACSTADDVAAAVTVGFRLLTVDWDVGMLAAGGRSTLTRARAGAAAAASEEL